MGLLSKAFPGWALKRKMREMQLRQLEKLSKRSGSFEATKGGRTRYDFLTNSSSPDTAITDDLNSLRNNIRHLEFNNGLVAGPIKRIKNNVVGKGFRLQSTVKPDEKYSREFPKIKESDSSYINIYSEKFFGLWEAQADVQLTKHFHEICGLAEMALIRDGEALVVARESKLNPNRRIIPYCLQGYEIDRLDTPMQEISNPNIRHGIEYDSEGVPKKYYLLKQHPGESLIAAIKRSEYEEVDAFFPNGRKKVFHLFDPIRFEQTRGFPEFAAGLRDIQDAERYMEAEKFAALMQACTTMTYKSTNPSGAVAGLGITDENSNKIFEFAPGAQWNIDDDESIEWHNPNRPNTAFGEFVSQLMRGPANSVDVPPEVLTQNWQGMNYSNARTVLLQFYLTCALRQFFLTNHLCNPVYEGVFYSLVAKGKLSIPGFERRPYDFMRHAWIPNGWQWVDPLKESQAAKSDVNNGFSDPYTINASRGQDADETLEKMARWLKRKKDLEEQYEVKFPGESKQPVAQTDEPDEGDNKEDDSRAILSVV
jgi:lambda family phage portal protein